MANNIFIIGLMGAGKTTVGQLLAKRMHVPFLDSDHVIEARSGVTVATIFEVEGEAAFRAREAAVIAELSQQQGVVLATGGGAIQNPVTREILKSRGTVFYLHATAATAYGRVRRNRERPLLKVEDPLARLEALYALRHPLYLETAHHVIESAQERAGLVVNEICARFERATEI